MRTGDEMVCYLFLFLLGAVVGSFLNVLIDRLPRQGKEADSGKLPRDSGESIIFGRSCCENCRTPLLWYDLIPILSFFWLRGKCRFCQAKIPVRLLIVELITGLGFIAVTSDFCGLVADSHGVSSLLLVTCYLFLFSSFVVLFFTDFEYGVLPDKIVFPAVVVILLWRITSLILDTKYLILNTKYGILSYLLSAFGLSSFFLLLIIITRGKGMGFGDVKLGFLIGLVLGWPGTLVAVFLAFLAGALVSVILIVGGKKCFGETVPFGPFLITGTAAAALFGSRIWEWYLGLL